MSGRGSSRADRAPLPAAGALSGPETWGSDKGGDSRQNGQPVALPSPHGLLPGRRGGRPQSPRGPAEQHQGEGRHPHLELLIAYPPPLQADTQGPAAVPQACPLPPTGDRGGWGQQGERRPSSGLVPISGPPKAPLVTIAPARPLTSPRPHPLPRLLLAARLGALGRAGVVPQHSSEAQGHPRVTAVHTHHGHLLLGRALREPSLAQQWLRAGKGRERKQWARSPLGSWAGHEDPAHTDSPLCAHKPHKPHVGRQAAHSRAHT